MSRSATPQDDGAYRHRVERLGAVEAHEHDVLARLIDLAELGLEGERHFGELPEPDPEPGGFSARNPQRRPTSSRSAGVHEATPIEGPTLSHWQRKIALQKWAFWAAVSDC